MEAINIAYYLMYVSGIVLEISIIAQIYRTYCLKSTQGIDSWMIYASALYSTLYTLFVHHFFHPFPHRFMSFITQALFYILVFQQFYYSSFYSKKVWARRYSFTSATLCILYFIAYNLNYIDAVGHVWGYLLVIIPLFTQLPQLYYNWQRKSVEGFSGWFVIFQIIGITLTLITSIAFNFRWPIWLNCLRGLLYQALYVVQFYYYGAKKFQRTSFLDKKYKH